MSYEIINIPQGINFIQDIPEFKQDLPDNVYLDKVTTGSGFTSAILTNSIDYVLAVPFKALGENKLIQSKNNSQYPYELFMYHSDVEQVNAKLTQYLERNKDKVKKIMVTYDSLPKLKTHIDFKDYKLAIDEGHKLLEYAGNFKPKVIHRLFEELHNFKSYIVATATPTREQFIPAQLADTKKLKLQWSSVKPVTFKHKRLSQNQLFEHLISLSLAHYRSELKGNAYIYFNSVKDIVKIVKVLTKFGLTSQDVKIISAINKDNNKNIGILGKGWKPKPVIEEDNPNSFYKINFVTSTAFEGQDFLDPEGVTYIVSDGKLEHTKLDISTQVSQIIGRLRLSKYKDQVNMLWTCSPIGSYRTEEEYQVFIDDSRAEANVKFRDFQRMESLDLKAKVIEILDKDVFFIDNTEPGEEPDLVLNPNAENHLMNSFVGTSLQYYVSTDQQTNEVQENVTYSIKDIFLGDVDDNLDIPKLSPVDKKKFRAKANFASRVRQYFDCKRNLYQYQQGLLDLSEQEINILESSILECETDQDFSIVTEYINIFGSKDIRDLSDSSLQPKVLQEKITKHYELKLLKDMLHSKYKVDDMILNTDLKQYLDYIKKKYDLSSALKLTDIGVAFEYKITCVKVNGKKENSIKLVSKL